MLEQKLNSLKTYKDKGLRTVIGCVWAFSIFTIGALSTMENQAKAELDNSYNAVESTVEEWYPWMLTANGDSQAMPELTAKDSHQRFKELCEKYWLDASKIWELENKYNIRDWVLLAILIAETSWWTNWAYVNEGCYNLWNVWNTDSWNRVCFEWKWESIEQVVITLNNRNLWKVLTLWCLSNAWSCVKYSDWGYRYATSNGNRERTIKNVLNAIYSEELWEIEPDKFSIRRDFISLQ